MPEYVLEIDAWDGASIETLRYGTKTKPTSPSDIPANTEYLGLIMDAGMLARSVPMGGESGKPSTSVGSIILNNGDGGLDGLVDYGFDGRAYRLKELDDIADPVANATVVAEGVLAGMDSSDAWHTLRLRIRDQLASLQKPLITVRYAGTTTGTGLGVEGDEDLTDQLKPIIFGSVTNVKCVLVNRFDLVYQVSQSAVSSITVYDGGLSLANGGDFSTLTTLMAATVAPGNYATCLALGIFKLGATPVFAVTADVVEGSTLALRSAARVTERMLSFLGISSSVIDSDSFTTLHTFNSAEVGIYIDSDINADDLIAEVLDSIGGTLIPTSDGMLRVLPISVPSGTAEATLEVRDISEDATFSLGQGVGSEGIPAWSVVINYARVYVPMGASELAGAATTARATLIASEYRTAVASSSSVQTAHPLSPTLTFNTLLTQSADATAEAARRLAMYSVRRDSITLTIPVDRGRYDLGAVLLVDIDGRFGFGVSGKLFRVIGRTDDFTKRQNEYELWG
jgi:hypothetical protein